MNAFVNYMIEANLGLLLFYGMYVVVFKGENQFSLKRFYLLGAIALSLSFPLLHLNSNTGETYIPSVSQIVPSYWLPEVVVGGNGEAVSSTPETAAPTWSVFETVYWIAFGALAILFVTRMTQLIRLILKSQTYSWHRCYVAESTEEKPTFSFFHFIFIGQANRLSPDEKLEVLNHEAIHVQRLHSLDVVLTNFLGIFFWFNPVVALFKKSLTQLHEYEADAQTVADRDADVYCGLLAKVALQSTEFSLANHFNNSLTVKRIAMIKSIKTRIKLWKIVPVVAVASVFFFAVACQDQVASDLKKVAQGSHMTEDLPKEINAELERLKAAHPTHEYIVIENTKDGKETLDRLWKGAGKYGIDTTVMQSMTVFGPNGTQQSYTFLRKGTQLNELAYMTVTDDRVFTVVEEMATPKDGMKAFQEYVIKNVRYPDSARQAGIEGKVLISFIVDTNGTLSDFVVMKGLPGGCNMEAIRVLSESPTWSPAKQEGVAVKQRMVVPIVYSLAANKPSGLGSTAPEAVNDKMDVAFARNKVNDKIVAEGNVWGRDGKPLTGVHIILKNSTTGTTTGPDGHFKFETSVRSGTLVFSHIGFDSVEHSL